MAWLEIQNGACATCRKRKKRCDRKKPACSRCITYGWKCPGYGEETEIFRDETKAIEDRVLAKYQRRLVRSSGNDEYRRPDQLLLESLETRPVQPSIEDRAICFFYYQYVYQGTRQTHEQPRGVYEFLPSLLRESRANDALPMATAAVGLASLSNTIHTPKWSSMAQSLYGRAIRQVHAAVGDPVLQQSDQTLTAIMLLGFYEFVNGTPNTSMKSFDYHLTAAANLINLRGPGQFSTLSSTRMLNQLRPLMQLNCVMKQAPVPNGFSQWSSWAAGAQSVDDQPIERITKICEDIHNIRAYIKLWNIASLNRLASLLLPQDKKLVKWFDELPTTWIPLSHFYTNVPDAELEYHLLEYDTYSDPFAASVVNSCRAVRISIHETLITTMLKEGIEATDDRVRASAKIIRNEVTKMCRSIPYHFSPKMSRGILPKTAKELDATLRGSPGAYLIMWPIYTGGMSKATPRRQRRWIADNLQRINASLGIRMAASLANNLRKQDVDMNFEKMALEVAEDDASRPRIDIAWKDEVIVVPKSRSS